MGDTHTRLTAVFLEEVSHNRVHRLVADHVPCNTTVEIADLVTKLIHILGLCQFHGYMRDGDLHTTITGREPHERNSTMDVVC